MDFVLQSIISRADVLDSRLMVVVYGSKNCTTYMMSNIRKVGATVKFIIDDYERTLQNKFFIKNF